MMGKFNSKSGSLLTIMLLIFLLPVFHVLKAEPKPKERNILAAEAKAIDLPGAIINDNTWNKLPGYKDRQFWEGLSGNIRQEYIKNAEAYLDYDWPVVKATDYLEFIRSGDRRQSVYSACSNALISLVMGEMTEGKGRFLDQIVNAVWYYSEQTWWGWSAHLGARKAGSGLPDANEPYVDQLQYAYKLPADGNRSWKKNSTGEQDTEFAG